MKPLMVSKFSKVYFELTCIEMDALCEWILEMRKKMSTDSDISDKEDSTEIEKTNTIDLSGE